MHHSSWDLEVHAREMQTRRLREAHKARQIDAARRDNSGYQSSWFSISRLMTLAQAWLSPRRTLEGATSLVANMPVQIGTDLPPILVEEPRLQPNALSSRLSQPYAEMVVLARGAAQTAEQPCGVGDC